jgi:hypothetical protein
MAFRKVEEVEAIARKVVGDGKSPNLFFVSQEGVILTVTRDFELAYQQWRALPRNVETALEDRKNGVIADTGPVEEGSKRLVTTDDSVWMGLR